MSRTHLKQAAQRARATWHDTDPDAVLAREISREAVETLVPVKVLCSVRVLEVRSEVKPCARCGGLMLHDPLPGRFWQPFPTYRCVNCGEVVDWQIVVNRYLQALGCETEYGFEQGYRRLRATVLQREAMAYAASVFA